MTVWAVFDGHRCLSVWTTEQAADRVRKRGQWVAPAALMPFRGVAAGPGMSAQPRSRTPLGE